ncbi:hypothetical protein [Methylobacillus glycogenes]|uniref:hypothetical protein n=1 Tax=Methylobacillus glycogenes TaxID=406 RepID=UPI00046FA9C8|nr:hypothetical protein [Methylobacillus glycogenes]
MVKKVLMSVIVLMMCSPVAAESIATNINSTPDPTVPIKHIGVYVTPYYQSADSSDGRPTVQVAKAFDDQLASNKIDDILAVRDAIQAKPQRTTPMTLMVLAIRLYDVGLRDDAVFWFYAAKNRYITMSDVLDVNSASLSQAGEAVKAFAVLAGPFINSYAFCDIAKQRDASARSISWVEQNPYEVMFMEQLPALPGNRTENLKKSISSIKERALMEQEYFDEPKNKEEFQKKRKEQHVVEQFCWAA